MTFLSRSIARHADVAALAIALAALCGCAKSCKNDHPYVPYSIEPSANGVHVEDGGVSAIEDDAGAQFQERPATVAPPALAAWTVDGLALTAPTGRTFVLALVRDFDGDGKRDAFAVVRATELEKTSPGELVYYRGKGADGTVGAAETIAGAADVVDDESCTPRSRMGLIGKRSVFVELAVVCSTPVSGASRWIAAMIVDKTAKIHLSALVFDPPNAAKMTIDADGADQDGDGVEDVALRVTLEGGSAPFEPGPKVSAILRWLDRPAGLSRDVSATEASLASLASQAMSRAPRAKDAPTVPLVVAQTRSLFRAICPEGGAPRIVRKVGAATMACGSSRALEEAGFAEVRAYATMGDALRAITALDRAQRPPATKSSARFAEAQTWIAQVAPSVAARQMRSIAAVPQPPRGRSPAWGSLAFEPGGKLLVRTGAGVARVDPEHGDEAAAEIAAWKSDVLSPDGAMQWIEAYDPCDGVALHATFAPSEKGTMKDVVLPIAPVFGPRCTSSKGEPAPSMPVAWGPGGLDAVVAGEPTLVSSDLSRATSMQSAPEAPFTLGSPRSPSGRVRVTPTSQGLLVRGARTFLYRATELDGAYASQRECAVSDDGARVACIRGSKGWVGIWEPPP